MRRTVYVSLIAVTVVVIAAAAGTANALPCCNNLGTALCNPDSPMWQYPLWSYYTGSGDTIISVDFCYVISCEGGLPAYSPEREVRSCEMPHEQLPTLDRPVSSRRR